MQVTVEHHREPFGIGESEPRISWRTSADTGWRQRTYELEIERHRETRRFAIAGSDQILVPWPDSPLSSREPAGVRVRVFGEDGSESAWSTVVHLEAGLLLATDWLARPVSGAWEEDPDSDARTPALVRRDFDVRGEVQQARLYVSAHGLYEVELNGIRIGQEALAPGWTPYGSHLRYASYDVSSALRRGQNAIGSWLGDGWYRGRLGWKGGFRNVFGFDQSLIAQLEITYVDGRVETIATDESWRAATGPILQAGNYDGEDYDARLEQPGWSSSGFDDSGWTPVRVHKHDAAILRARSGPPVRCIEEIRPVELLISPTGKWILDFGQNLVGRTRMRVSGPAGSMISLQTAEVLQSGDIYTRPLRSARSTDRYTLAGREGGEEWEPRFTFHGFRYVEVDGWPGDLQAAVAAGDIVARVYHTDLERTGWFSSSDADLNQLHDNIVWSMRGNFLDIPY
jgi:alpha-L-rhamnosidase